MTSERSGKNGIVVIITGASGSIYGLRLIEQLLSAKQRVTLLLSDSGRKVMQFETGIAWAEDSATMNLQIREHFKSQEITCYANNDFFSPIASGSSAPESVVIIPCSMGTVGRVSAGLSETLIERVADVALKERRELILVPRETPFNQIHLENLLRLSQAGAHIIPAMPAFYQIPESIDDLVNFVVGKVLDNLGVKHDLFQRWGDASLPE